MYLLRSEFARFKHMKFIFEVTKGVNHYVIFVFVGIILLEINLRKRLIFNFRSLLTTCLGRYRPSPLFVRGALTLESREAAHHWPTFGGYYLGQWCARTWREGGGGCDLVIPGGHRWNRFRQDRVQFSHFEQ